MKLIKLNILDGAAWYLVPYALMHGALVTIQCGSVAAGRKQSR